MSLSVQKTVCTECYSRFIAAAKGSPFGFQRFVCPRCSKAFYYPLNGPILGVYSLAAAVLAFGIFAAWSQGPAPAALAILLEAAVLAGLGKNFLLKKSLAAAQEKPAPRDGGEPEPAEAPPPPQPEADPKRKKVLIIAGGAAAVLLLLAVVFLLRGKKGAKPMSAAATVARSTAAVEGVVEWVAVPSGSYMMGSATGEAQEKPVHRVALKTFEIAKTPVTFGQYRRCVEAGACTPAGVSDGRCMVYIGSAFGAGVLDASFQSDDLPVVCVDWIQARTFSQWVGARLPTEAEWEYAARGAGREVAYPWGNETATCQRAVMYEAAAGCSKMGTAPVCSKPEGKTPEGLCDMAGNVYQWVQDWSHPSYDGAPVDGAAWEIPPGAGRVFRGGSWTTGATALRSAARGRDDPHARTAVLGFRPVRERHGADETRDSQEAKTRAALISARRALTAYRQEHQGGLPTDLAAFLSRPSAQVPPYHTASMEIHLFSSLQDTSIPETGGWALVVNSKSKDYGSFFVNCTHTDGKGSSWDSY